MSYLKYMLTMLVLLLTVASFASPAAAQQGRAEMPQVFLNTEYAPSTGASIIVPASGDLQAAINAAQPGDEVVLEAGATFIGNFTLPRKPDGGPAQWVVIRSSSTDFGLPPPGVRVFPEHAPLMAKIITPNSAPAVRTAAAAHHYRLVGIEIGIAPEAQSNSGIVLLGDGSRDQNSLELVARDLIIDRCYIHGNPATRVKRGVALNSARTAIIDSYISECHDRGVDSQAVCGWNGPGPFKIVNNWLEGAGENILFGGADPKIADLVPADIEIRRNHFIKPLTWKKDHPEYAGGGWTVKNLFELKNARRVLVDGNIFEHNWADGQTGYAILLKAANSDGGAPWSVTEDVTFTNNIVRHSGGGVNILGRDYEDPSEQVKRIVIRNNLFYGIDKARWGGDGAFLKITETKAVEVEHNTVIQTGNVIVAYGVPNKDFVFRNNIALHNKYGVKGESTAVGNDSIDKFFPGRSFKKNVIVGARPANYPEKNYYPASLDEVAFVDPAYENYYLAPASPYKGGGGEGRDIGANIDAIIEAILRGA